MLRYFKAQAISVCVVALAHDDDEMAAVGATRGSGGREARGSRDAREEPGEGGPAAGDRPAADARAARQPEDAPRARARPPHVAAGRRARVLFRDGAIRHGAAARHTSRSSWTWWTWTRSSGKRWLVKAMARADGCIGARHACCDVSRPTATRAARATLVVSEREAEALTEPRRRRSRPSSCPTAWTSMGFRNPGEPSARPEVVFTGVFSYQPNEDGALWLMEHVWPGVRAKVPQAHLTLVGMGPSATLRSRAAAADVEVTGTVPDVRPYLWRAAVAVAPLDTARGVQNKVLEAVAAGLPAVVTPAVYDGLPDAVATRMPGRGGCDRRLPTRSWPCLANPPRHRRALASRAHDRDAHVGGLLAAARRNTSRGVADMKLSHLHVRRKTCSTGISTPSRC